MATRNQSILTLSRVSAVLLLVVLVLVNAVFARSSSRLDLTEDGRYTLMDGTKRIMKSLRDPAAISVFWHKVPGADEQKRYLEYTLEEMRDAADGRLSVRWVDLEDEDGKEEAEKAKIDPHPFQGFEGSDVRLALGYDSLLIEMGAKKEIISDLVNHQAQFEYLITSTLYRMSVTDVVVGLVVTRAATPQMNPFQGADPGRFRFLANGLREQFGAQFRSQVSLQNPVAEDVDVLVLAAPQDMEDTEVFNLEQFMLRGGRVLLLADPVHAAPGEAPADQPTSMGVLDDWLAALGVTVEGGTVGDMAAYLSRPRMSRTHRQLERVGYPYWVLVLGENIDQTNLATRGFDQVPLYWPAAISVSDEIQTQAGRTATVMAASSDQGIRRPDLIGLDMAEKEDLPDAEYEASIPFMVLLEGPASSYWKGKPKPGEEPPEDEPTETEDAPEESEPLDDEGTEDAGDPQDPVEPDESEPADDEDTEDEDTEDADAPEESEPIEEAPEESGPKALDDGRIFLVVVGDAELVSDGCIALANYYRSRVFLGGMNFAANIVDWLGGGEDLLSLRARDHESRTLDETEASKQTLITWANILAIPLLLLFAGIVVFIVRRN